MFHLVFVGASVVLAAFSAAWAAGMYRSAGDAVYLAGALTSMLAAVGLVVYGAKFQKKMRTL
jgi:hypothetical protein